MIPVLVALAALALFAAGCGGEGDSPSTSPGADDSGLVHVHGLGVNPKDGSLFIATHTGLFRSVEEGAQSQRVGNRQQDTMGFTVVGPDRFLGSGHPGPGDQLPPLLGLIESRDAGQTWEPISQLGKADFHVLEASGRRVYGFDSSGGRLMASVDAGGRWAERVPPEPLLSLAIDPRDPRNLLASGGGGLYTSTDEGRRWREMRGDAGLLTWPAGGRPYLVRADGGVMVLRGGRWSDAGEIGGQPAAFEANGPRELYAALHDGTVKRSTDGGESWSARSGPN